MSSARRILTPIAIAVSTACGGDGTGPSDSGTVPPPAELTIQYVRRLPSIDYVWGSTNARTEGWPALGQTVTWQAAIRSWFPKVKTVTVAWLMDGTEVARKPVTIPPNGVGTAEYPWAWTFDRHELTVVVDPDNVIAEEEEGNNRLAVFTDALSVGFYVEQSVYDYFREHQRELPGIHSTTFEDWAQRQIARYNTLLAGAVYPETPNGVTDRVRLDRITIVPDGALPLDRRALDVGGNFEAAAARPNIADLSVDLQWGFPARDLSAYTTSRKIEDNNQFYYSGFVQHEMGHARTMIDVYGVSVYDGIPGHAVDLIEGTTRVAGSPFMPGSPVVFNGFSGIQLYRSEEGLMASDWTRMDRYSAVMWNRIAGQRARFGNYNEPENLGDFLNDLPASNRLTLLDGNGVPLAGARVSVFQASPLEAPNAVVYGRRFDPTPDLELVADNAGEVELGQNPFAKNGPVTHGKYPSTFSNAVVIVRVEAAGKVGYGFLPATELNVQYDTGHRDVGRYRMTVTLR